MSLECCSSRSRQRQGAALCPKACSLSHCSSAASSWFAPPFLIRRARQLIPLACTFAQARSSAPSQATNGLYRPKIVGESANFLYLISTLKEKEKERKKPTKLASSRYFIHSLWTVCRKKDLQHLDFARGPPPHYYPGQDVLNFADQTGCGALTTVWP